ncbi:MAG: AbrB/MazE/SpoVT family DNA-binding domain-containing protein [Bryobacteraceae bacterium]
MSARLIIDKAGRVVIPKPLREARHLEPGDSLEIESAGEQITLRPVRGTGPLRKEHGVWVLYAGQPLPASATDEVLEEIRRARFIQFDRATGCCGAHSLAEVYSTLTRMPGKHRISSEQAILFIGSIRERFIGSICERLSIIALTGEEYVDALEHSAARGVVGGGIYDSMLAHCALKAKVEAIYSWNVRHYSLCDEDVVRRLRTP